MKTSGRHLAIVNTHAQTRTRTDTHTHTQVCENTLWVLLKSKVLENEAKKSRDPDVGSRLRLQQSPSGSGAGFWRGAEVRVETFL